MFDFVLAPGAERKGRHLRLDSQIRQPVPELVESGVIRRGHIPDQGQGLFKIGDATRELGQDLGVYATVRTPGTVAIGDPVTIDG